MTRGLFGHYFSFLDENIESISGLAKKGHKNSIVQIICTSHAVAILKAHLYLSISIELFRATL
jgi:hypothetical protein